MNTITDICECEDEVTCLFHIDQAKDATYAMNKAQDDLARAREQVRALTATNMDQRVMLSETRTEAHGAAEVIGGLMIERDEVQAERDRLHKAITEALAEEERRTDQGTRMWRILRAALDN